MHRAREVLGIETFALEPLGQGLIGLGHHLDQGQALTPLQRRAQRIGKPLLNALTGHEAIDDHFDVVGVVLVEFDVVGELAHLTVDAHPCKALGHQAAEQLDVGAFLAADHRCQQLVAGVLGQPEDLIDHLVDRLRPNRTLALGAVGFAGAAEQQAQIVLDLGDRADGRTGVVTGGFLVDRNRRRQPFDRIDIGLVDLTQKLARVGRQAFDVAALSLSKDRVEGQRALAAAADAGEHHQPVARNRQINVLEVVLAGTPHPDHVLQRAAIEHPAAVQLAPALGRLLMQGEGRWRLAGRARYGRLWRGLAALGAGHPAWSGTADSMGTAPGHA